MCGCSIRSIPYYSIGSRPATLAAVVVYCADAPTIASSCISFSPLIDDMNSSACPKRRAPLLSSWLDDLLVMVYLQHKVLYIPHFYLCSSASAEMSFFSLSLSPWYACSATVLTSLLSSVSCKDPLRAVCSSWFICECQITHHIIDRSPMLWQLVTTQICVGREG